MGKTIHATAISMAGMAMTAPHLAMAVVLSMLAKKKSCMVPSLSYNLSVSHAIILSHLNLKGKPRQRRSHGGSSPVQVDWTSSE